MIIYYDSFSILVINSTGRVRRIYTPFRVRCTNKIDDLEVNTSCFVDEVLEDEDEKLLYLITGNLYPFNHFSITIKF